MSINIHVLDSHPAVKPYAAQLRLISRQTVRRIQKFLTLREIDVVYMYNPGETIPEIGIGGFTPNAHTVYVSLDLDHPRFVPLLISELPRQLAHEFHHAVRWRNPGYGATLFEALVSEGLADHFLLETMGGSVPPWCVALDASQKKRMLKHAMREWNSPKYIHARWFFGSAKYNIPRWTGYTLGFDLVAAYLETHPDAQASSLVSTPAARFIQTLGSRKISLH